MRVRARQWISYNGAFHRAGEEFDILDEDFPKDVYLYCDPVKVPTPPEDSHNTMYEDGYFQSDDAEDDYIPPVRRRGRPRKNAE